MNHHRIYIQLILTLHHFAHKIDTMRRSAGKFLQRSARALEQVGFGLENTTTSQGTRSLIPFAALSRTFADSSDQLLKTALYDFHVENGGA